MSAVQDFMERARKVRQSTAQTTFVLTVRGDDAVKILDHIEALEANEVTFHQRIRYLAEHMMLDKGRCGGCSVEGWESPLETGVLITEEGVIHGH